MITRAKTGIYKPLERMNCHVTSTYPLHHSHMHALRDPNWKEAMYKARLVANGRSQQQCLVYSLARRKECISSWTLFETVYMYQPPGFVDSARPDYVFHLEKLLYSFKQASRAWFQRLASFATRIGFQHTKTDASLFIYHHGSDIGYLLLYVVDIIHIASSTALLPHIITSLLGEFAMTYLGSLNFFLGVSAHQTVFGLYLSQSKFFKEVLERAHMQHRNSYKTPESKLGLKGDLVAGPTLLGSLVGGLQYLTFMRPDLSYAVHQVCLYMHDPRESHLLSLKNILRYVYSTLDHGLQLYASSTSQLVVYTDADWAGCRVTRHSTSGYCVFLGDNLLFWSLKAMLTCLVLHIEIDIHFVHDYVDVGQVRVLHVPSRFNFVDIFAKELHTALFLDFRTSLNAQRPPGPLTGKY
uniref:Reverse transcriptase Ty1/copia-type domain-containing protein n=1 Tax=Tanacetum cinerariifolium TaxID=118510 RepID=A0A699K0E1_TANCI|nr:hypothetical protein [Tanacetum cinerariifolium]